MCGFDQHGTGEPRKRKPSIDPTEVTEAKVKVAKVATVVAALGAVRSRTGAITFAAIKVAMALVAFMDYQVRVLQECDGQVGEGHQEGDERTERTDRRTDQECTFPSVSSFGDRITWSFVGS